MYGFVSVGSGDINFFIPPKFTINLWHGIPLKKIGFDDKITANYKSTFIKLPIFINLFIHK